jgi:TATA-binding protein-associated factor Taf7
MACALGFLIKIRAKQEEEESEESEESESEEEEEEESEEEEEEEEEEAARIDSAAEMDPCTRFKRILPSRRIKINPLLLDGRFPDGLPRAPLITLG